MHALTTAPLGQVAASIGKGPIIARATHPRMGVREAAVLLLGKLEPKDLGLHARAHHGVLLSPQAS